MATPEGRGGLPGYKRAIAASAIAGVVVAVAAGDAYILANRPRYSMDSDASTPPPRPKSASDDEIMNRGRLAQENILSCSPQIIGTPRAVQLEGQAYDQVTLFVGTTEDQTAAAQARSKYSTLTPPEPQIVVRNVSYTTVKPTGWAAGSALPTSNTATLAPGALVADVLLPAGNGAEVPSDLVVTVETTVTDSATPGSAIGVAYCGNLASSASGWRAGTETYGLWPTNVD